MKFCGLILFMIFTTFSYSQNTGQSLENAFVNRSHEMLRQFFLDWSNKVPTITVDELSNFNDTIRQTYDVFTAFYKPHRIDSLGGSEFGNEVYKFAEFLIVQNNLRIYFTEKIFYTEPEIDSFIVDYVNKNIFTDSTREMLLKRDQGRLSSEVLSKLGPYDNIFAAKKKLLTDSIVNFRPVINCDGKLPLYLTPAYDSILNQFLGEEYIPLGHYDIMMPAYATELSKTKSEFLEKFVKIFYGHWGGYWQLLSYPEAFSVTFDKNMQYAKINFRMIYEGGEAMLKKLNGKWTLISARSTWIE